jgi:hypothetical protein
MRLCAFQGTTPAELGAVGKLSILSQLRLNENLFDGIEFPSERSILSGFVPSPPPPGCGASLVPSGCADDYDYDYDYDLSFFFCDDGDELFAGLARTGRLRPVRNCGANGACGPIRRVRRCGAARLPPTVSGECTSVASALWLLQVYTVSKIRALGYRIE